MSGRHVGEFVWVPDDEIVWRAAEVVQVEGNVVTVETDNNQRKSAGDGSNLLQRDENEYTGGGLAVIDDLTQLVHLHEASVLNSMQHGFDLDTIYTFTGPILLAINPFKSIAGLYDEAAMKRFLNASKSEPPKPHVYATASLAYRSMREKRSSQTVLISGESGAGKTETTKHVMKLATSTSTTTSNVEERILATNPILEALGNAKTSRNDNSSRFGKFIELNFEDKDEGDLCSSNIQTYLLEKVRVTDQHEGERNYHLFYQACAASQADKAKRTASGEFSLRGLDKCTSFAYLTRSSVTIAKASIDDAVEFETTIGALRSIGFCESDIASSIDIVSAVLNVGNLSFEIVGDNADASKTTEAAAKSLASVSECLGVDVERLEQALCTRTIKTRGEVMRSPVRCDKAGDARDALARQLYASLFDLIGVRVNESIGLQAGGASAKTVCIGVLDIFGFECFKTNSFEQLCINLTNERLQQFFNTFVFKLEQDLYKREDIPFDAQDFPDNTDVLELIEGKAGILAMLDEECKVPKGSDQGFNGKLWKQFDKHARFAFVRHKPTLFTVKHFAGNVEYVVEGFMEKNKDALLEDLVESCYGSSSPFVKSLFEDLHAKLEADAQPAKGKKAASSVSSKFKSQLGALMSAINKTDPHFIRCIKPNPQNKPDIYDRKGVTEQLRYQGVLQVVKVSRAGYPVRISCEDGWNNYRIILSNPEAKAIADKAGNMQARAQNLVSRLTKDLDIAKTPAGSPGAAVGRTMIFLRQEAFEKLRAAQLKVQNKACCIVQARVRCHSQRRMFKLKRMVVISMQSSVRTFIAKRKLRRLRIQRDAGNIVQAAWRGYKGRQIAHEMRRHRAARKIQATARGLPDKRAWARIRIAVRLSQEHWRCLVARETRKRLKTEAKDLGNLATNLLRQKEELTELRKDKDLLEGKAVQLDAAHEELEKVTQRKDELEAEVTKLKKMLAEAEVWRKRTEELDVENKDLKARLEELESSGVPIVRRTSSGRPSISSKLPVAVSGPAEENTAPGSRRSSGFSATQSILSAINSSRSANVPQEKRGNHVDIQIVGSCEVGKTSMLEGLFKDNNIDAALKQLEVSRSLMMVHYFVPNVLVNSAVLPNLKLLDCSGEERASRLVVRWFANANWVVLIFDPSRLETFEHVRRMLPEVQKAGSKALLVSNPHNVAKGEKRTVPSEMASTVAREHDARFLETQAFNAVLEHTVAPTPATSVTKNSRRQSVLAATADQLRGLGGAKVAVKGRSAEPLKFTVFGGKEGLHCVEECMEFLKDNSVTCMCFAREGDPADPTDPVLLAVASKLGSIVVFRARRTPNELQQVGLTSEPSKDGDVNSDSSDDETGKILTLYQRMTGHTRAVTSMFFVNGQQRLVSTSIDQTFRIWDVATGENLTIFTDSSPVVVASRVPRTKDIFVTANAKALVRLINSETGAVLQKLKVEHEVRALTFDTDYGSGCFLILGTRAGVLYAIECMRDPKTGTNELKPKIQKFKLSKAGVTCLTHVPGRGDQHPRLLANSWDSSVAIIDCIYDASKKLSSFIVRNRLKVSHFTLPIQNCHAYGDDSSRDDYLISGSEDNKVYIYNLSDYRMQHLEIHRAPVMAVAVSATNTLLVSADAQGVLSVWRRGAPIGHQG
eukprot:TRINITY_DN28629_c0_g1_i1.p1 TRINITY_DN28629_c0_g1~~TRINITY_DN28629_c0_g1_i1.p1  ORF type:complete len:1639 (-),score=351.19 TRINITY_DN28629_c0_g1_i1:61-4977(-)